MKPEHRNKAYCHPGRTQIQKLKELSDCGACTVVCTIHQPQSKIFQQFDNLLLLKKGTVIYQGKAELAVGYFADAGFPCPQNENPADHFLDIISPLGQDLGIDDQDTFKNEYDVTDQDLLLGFNKRILPRDQVPWHIQFKVLFQRSLKEQWRKKNLVAIQILQTIFMAILIGTVFLQIGHDQSFINTRQSVLFFCCINQGIFGALITINSFPGERVLSLRERAAGTYHVSAYFLAKSLAEALTQLFIPLTFSCIVYFLIGLQPIAGKFFIFMIFMVLCSFAATSVALAISTLSRTVDLAVTILPMILEIFRLFGGFFLPPKKLPKYYSWLDALSYVKYSYVGVSLNELGGLVYNCTESQFVTVNGSTTCPVTSGEEVMETLGLNYLPIYACVLTLIGYIIACRILAYLGAKYITW